MARIDAWHGISEARTPYAISVPTSEAKSRNSSDPFSTIGTKIIHSYTPARQAFFSREGKSSAELETAFSLPRAPLGGILVGARPFDAFRGRGAYRKKLPLSTLSEPRLRPFSTSKRMALERLLLLGFLRYVERYALRYAFLNELLTDNVTFYYLNTSTPSIPSRFEVLSLCANKK